MHWYLQAWKNSFKYSGRARRREYWWFMGVNSVIAAVLAAGCAYEVLKHGVDIWNFINLALVEVFVMHACALVVTVPSISLNVRRLHDTGRSGWWLLITLVPFLGGLIFLIFTLLDSEQGENQYGPNPKA